MAELSKDVSGKAIRSVTLIGAGVNVFLAVVKIAVGAFFGSLALVSDGLHSFTDLSSDFAVLVGAKLGSREPDHCHPFGHGRAETMATFVIVLVLIAVGGAMIYFAAMEIARGEVTEPSWVVLFAAVISVVCKEVLYNVTLRVARRVHSSSLYANAWHHRSDALSSFAVIVGVAAGFMGFEFGDQIAAIAVGLMIILVAAGIMGGVIREFSERAADEQTQSRIHEIVSATPQIRDHHRLRTRLAGRELFIDLHIQVDAELNVDKAHRISEKLERNLERNIERPVNILVHIEPWFAENKVGR